MNTYFREKEFVRMGTSTAHMGKIFCINPEAPEIKKLTPPPFKVITKLNQLCIFYSGVWKGRWGGMVLDAMRENGCSLEWQCYLGSYLDCKMTKQRKPACFRCEFKYECNEVAKEREHRR